MKSLTYFFAFLMLLPTLQSCIKESDRTAVDEGLKYEAIAQEITQRLNIFDDLVSNRNPIPLNLTQELVDEYLVALEYEPGEVTVEEVEEMITDLGIATTEGVQVLLNEYGLSQFTKNAIETISQGEVINNLNEIPDYLMLNQNEKDLIQLANTVTQIGINEGRSCAGWGGVGAIVGVILGGTICPVCIVVGGILGGSLGCQAGGGKNP